MINPVSNINQSMPQIGVSSLRPGGNQGNFGKAVKAVNEYVTKVDEMQQSSDMSIKDLLTGKNEDVTSVVSAVAKADMSFKLLVGVRNKLIEAYQQTMNMQI